MSDGTLNLPYRVSHPSPPATGRTKRYIFDNGSGTVEPYYMNDDGVPRTMVGTQGPQGVQGVQGPQGIQGAQGPQGPMRVELVVNDTTQITLPNTEVFQTVKTNSYNQSGAGSCYLMFSIGYSAHSTSSDTIFQLLFDGVPLIPNSVEEAKDSDNLQSMLRSYIYPLGSRSAGSHTVNLRFRKEIDGGTTLLKGYSVVVVRYS